MWVSVLFYVKMDKQYCSSMVHLIRGRELGLRNALTRNTNTWYCKLRRSNQFNLIHLWHLLCENLISGIAIVLRNIKYLKRKKSPYPYGICKKNMEGSTFKRRTQTTLSHQSLRRTAIAKFSEKKNLKLRTYVSI